MQEQLQLTSEQETAATSSVDRLCIEAGAGTGKTQTLVRYASLRSHLRGLYLVFNASVRLDAVRRLPATCAASTFHSLAFADVGKQYANAGKLVSSIKPSSILHLLDDSDVVRRLVRARLAIQAVAEFTYSPDRHIRPSSAISHDASKNGIAIDMLVSDARRLWRSMVDLTDRSVGITHDGYFKIWAHSGRTDLSAAVDYIIVDEAQDLSLIAHSVLQAQTIPLVYVGDSRQSIYAFRGTSDCLSSMHADLRLALTKSFRFGPAIASFVNQVSARYSSLPGSLIGAKEVDAVCPVQRDLPFAVLTRTNAGAFAVAVEHASMGKRIHFVGGIENYSFPRLLQLHSLSAGNLSSVTDPFFRTLGSMRAVKSYAELVCDAELKSMCKVVETYGRSLPRLLSAIKLKSVHTRVPGMASLEQTYPADVYISTAHKSKGLEFLQVHVADDFPALPFPTPACRSNPSFSQEVNLLYVLLTRACTLLDPPSWLHAHPKTPHRAATGVIPIPTPPLPHLPNEDNNLLHQLLSF